MTQNHYEERIIELLKSHPEGLTILEISEKLKANRATVTKYIYKLYGAGKIKFRKVGPAKLCYLNKKVKAKILILPFLLMFLIPSISFAQVLQSHPLSEITPIDTSLNMYGYNITNVSYVAIGTALPNYPLHVVGNAYFTGNLITESSLFFGTGGPRIYASGSTLYTSSPLVLGGNLDLANNLLLNALLGSNLNANNYNITNANVIFANKLEGALDWSNLQNYPAGCPAGQAVQVIGDTLTCIDISTNSNITGSGQTNALAYWSSSTSLSYLNFGTSGQFLKSQGANNLPVWDFITLGTDTEGNYVANITAGTGISVSGTPGEGWSPIVSVVFGSTAGTVAEGNKQITVLAGSGLSGGGTITIGAGGSVTLDVGAGTGIIVNADSIALNTTYLSNNYIDEGQVAGGDLAGSYPNPTVVGLQGRPVSNIAPASDQALVWNGTHWVPTSVDISSSNELQNIWYTIAVPSGTNPQPDSTSDTLTLSAGAGITITGNASTDTITFAHADTSNQSSLDNAAGVVIQDVTLDNFGHVTSLGTVDLDTRYYTKSLADSRFANVDQAETISGSWVFSDDVTFQKNIYVAGNISYVNAQTLNVNGSIIPPLDNWFDLGNSSNRWRNAYFAGTVYANSFEGSISASNVQDIWVNESGDTMNGTLTITAGGLQVTGGNVSLVNLNVDSGTLYVDETNNRVGVGLTTPLRRLHVYDGDIMIDISIGGKQGVLFNEVLGSSSYEMGIVYNGTGTGNANRIDIIKGPALGGYEELVSITAGGFVGINNTNPSYTLDVTGNIYASGFVKASQLCIGNDCRNAWPGGVSGTGSAGQVAFWTGADTISGDNGLYWDNTNKRLGIGTTAPAYPLDVAGTIRSTIDIRAPIIYDSDNTAYYVNPASTTYLNVLTTSGNVGIGTTTPLKRLDVNGETLFRTSNTTKVYFDSGYKSQIYWDQQNNRLVIRVV